MEKKDFIPIKAKIRRHGTSLGINFKKEIAEQLNLNEGQEILVFLSSSIPSSPMEEDFIRWQRDTIKKQVLQNYSKRYQKNKKLFQEWYSKRVEQVDFFAYDTIDEVIEIQPEDEFSPPQPFHLKLEENKIILLPFEIAKRLEKKQMGKIVRHPIPQEEWLDDFNKWMKERQRYETFLKLHPHLKNEYKQEVKKGKLITYKEFLSEKYEDWKNKKIEF